MKKFISSRFFSSKFRVQGLLVLSLLVQGLLVQSYGANWYLSTAASGNGLGDVDWSNKALWSSFNWSQVDPGDVVYFDGGSSGLTYANGSTEYTFDCSGNSSNRVTITRGVEAGHNGLPLITGTNTNVIILSEDNDYLTIDGLGFRPVGGSSSSLSGQTIRVQGSDYLIIQNCELTLCYNKGIRLGYSDGQVIGAKILNNLYDTGTTLPAGGGPDGMWLGNEGGDLEVAYNRFMMRHTNTTGGYHKDIIQTYFWQTDGSTSWGKTKIHHNFFMQASPTMDVNTILELSSIGGDWEIYNNVIVVSRLTSGRAVYLGNCVSEGGEGVPFSARIYNNTVYASGTADLNCISVLDSDTSIIKNNLFYHTSGAWTGIITSNVTHGGYMDVDYNQYVVQSTSEFNYRFTACPNSDQSATTYSLTSWRSGGQDVHSEIFTSTGSFDFVGSSSYSTNPLDYALEGSSTGIDEGTTISLVTDDYSGNPRPVGSAPDVGAFEFGSAPPAATKKVRVIIIQ